MSSDSDQTMLIAGSNATVRPRKLIGEIISASMRGKYTPAFPPEPPKSTTRFCVKHFCEVISKKAALPSFQAISDLSMANFYLA